MIPGLLAAILALVGKAIDKAVPDSGQADQLKTQISTQVFSLAETEMKGAIATILAEAQGQSWLQRNWRPLLMLTCITIIANNYILYPYMRSIFGWGVALDLPEALWDLLKLGVGGYVVGRSVEKGIDLWRNGPIRSS